MNKPIKPNITILQSFAENGIKTDFDSDLLTDGFDDLRPDVLAGDNLNKFIDDTYKGLNYGIAAGDAINLIQEGETLTVQNGQLVSGSIGGGGLELCDIGTALYVDETKGLRRRLNGSIMDITSNYQAFLTRLLKIKATNPDYFTDEATWQNEATLNVDGCVYKFVLNYDSTGTNVVSVRLPKYPDYVEVSGIQTSGGIVKLKLYYFIQVATSQETENNIVSDIELNNPFTFGMSQYYKGEMNNISWLKSNGEYHPKATYPSFYNWILTNVNAGKDGFKLSTATDITDYDFAINTADESFRLPLKNGMEGAFASGIKGNGITIGLTNNTNNFGMGGGIILPTNIMQNMMYDTRAYGASVGTDESGTTSSNSFRSVGLTTDPTKSGIVVDTTVPEGWNLYYYVGETVQNEGLIDAGRIAEELGNKLDSSNTEWAINACMPDYSAGVKLGEPSEYRTLPCDCFVTISADNPTRLGYSGFWFASPDEKVQFYYAIAHQYKISNFGLNIQKGWKVKSYTNESTITYYPLKGVN